MSTFSHELPLTLLIVQVPSLKVNDRKTGSAHVHWTLLTRSVRMGQSMWDNVEQMLRANVVRHTP